MPMQPFLDAVPLARDRMIAARSRQNGELTNLRAPTVRSSSSFYREVDLIGFD